MNIILIGMPGAGKSTIGVLLAKALGMPFTDTDLLIQQNENRLLQDIINKDGMDTFLEAEERSILRLQAEGTVIATGGSVVYREKSMNHLKKSGKVFYLKLECDEIERRIMNITTRGIAMGACQDLKCLYNERIPLYEKYADELIDCFGKSIEEIVSEIKKRVNFK
ncbi:MAG: shikimate kinase [Clostridia bacterium]|nr:shikimate kinase [Clostridia bacterium]